MNIAIDLRSLQNGQFTGVENYTQNLVDALLHLDKGNSYKFFYNRLKAAGQALPEMHYVNSTLIQTRFPNRLLNIGLALKTVKLERLLGPMDCLFLPNLNQFNVDQKTKVAMTVHDLSPVVAPEFYDFRRRLWHKFLFYKRSLSRADVIFAVSHYTKQDLLRIYGIPEEKIKVVYPAVEPGSTEFTDTQLRAVRNAYGLPGEFILFLNTIEPRKNLSSLVKA
ncbi:MAG: glycosyltransferase, partial [Patescibacteria group bacterium]|nr:glycosyltransferase [Patescibacteria group bacterium]